MRLRNVMDVADVRKVLWDFWQEKVIGTERLPLASSFSEILAEDVHTAEAIPAFRRSTVDGYAVVAKDTAAAGESLPTFLKLQGAVEMGQVAQVPLESGQCLYVPTGGMVPDGADAVVMVEYCEAFGTEEIAVSQAVACGENVVSVGEDAPAGQRLLEKGTLLTPHAIGALAAAGVSQVPVFRKPQIAILSTGDELISPAQQPQGGQVRDINTYALGALAQKHHYSVYETKVLPDDGNALAAALTALMPHCDLICISGGSSQGTKDMTAQIIQQVSSPGVAVDGMAIKPGKPTILGFDRASGTVLAGLPGHPVSAILVFETLFGDLMRKATDQKDILPQLAVMAQGVAGSPGRTTCQPVRLLSCDCGYEAVPVFGKSGLITSLTQADGYVVIPRNQEGLKAGESVAVYLL